MSAPTSMAKLAGYGLGQRTATWEERDAILFALAVGAGPDDLDLVWEEQLQVLPTMAMAIGLDAVRAAGRIGVYDPLKTLHVGQQLRVHAPLPAAGTVQLDSRIGQVWDKGSAAILTVEVTSDLFDATYSIFVPGAGGFNGDSATPTQGTAPVGEPAGSFQVPTDLRQALLYRLTGDRHPAHVDPRAASALGLGRPILHGLCTLSATALALAKRLGHPPWALSALAARFSAPVYPGATIDADYWQQGDEALFEAKADGQVVLKSCSARFS